MELAHRVLRSTGVRKLLQRTSQTHENSEADKNVQ